MKFVLFRSKKFTYEELKENTPEDKGQGNWTNVEITV